MYVLLDAQVTVVVAVPVTVAVSPWWRSGVASVNADSLSVMATVGGPVSAVAPSSVFVPVSVPVPVSGPPSAGC